jgi:hypothetical protein
MAPMWSSAPSPLILAVMLGGLRSENVTAGGLTTTNLTLVL